jgi:FixJ family two-component response regulator
MKAMKFQSLGRPRVLLVEDDAAVRRSLQLLLRAKGFDVRAYSSPLGLAADQEALRSDCLVADLMMPEGDAVDLLTELRSAGWDGPALLISGFLTGEREARARAAGFQAVLPKPLADQAIADAVGRLLREASGER